MSSNGLHIAIKDAMKQMGEAIIASPTFVNILSDLLAFSDFPACKVILKDLQDSGELGKVYLAYKGKGKSCMSEIDKVRLAVQKNSKYKKALVSYVFDCFLYAFGIINNVNKPESNAYDAYAKQGSILDTLDEQLNDLKNEYLSTLEKNIILPKDMLHEPAGYFSAEVMNELFLIESKYKVIAETLGNNESDWCDRQFTKKVDKHRQEKENACKNEIERLKRKYSSVLFTAKPNCDTQKSKPTDLDSKSIDELKKIEDEIKKMFGETKKPYDGWCTAAKAKRLAEFVEEYKNHSIVILHNLKQDYVDRLENDALDKRSGGILSKSAVYKDEVLEELKPLEIRIKELYSEIERKYDNFCEKKRDEIFSKYQVSPQKRRKQVLQRIILPLIILSLPFSWGVQYIMFKDDIAKFNQQMEKAESLVGQDYSSALLAYDEAADGYNHGFLGKKGDADKAIEELVKAICYEANDLVDQNKLVAAKAKLNEIPSSVLTDREDAKRMVSTANEKIAKTITDIREKLISNISKNGGKLDVEGKKLLDEALLVSPDDYWLKIIKSKEK